MRLAVSRAGSLVALIMLGATFAGSRSLDSRLNATTVRSVQLTQIPMDIGDWRGSEADQLSQKHHDILKLDEYIRRTYRNSKGEEVFVYVGYWRKQSSDHQAAKHSPLMCLPANGWSVTAPEARTVPLSGSVVQPVRQITGSQKTMSLLFEYWFFSGEKQYTDESAAMLNIVREALIHARSDGGIVEVSSPIRSPALSAAGIAESQRVIDSFLVDFVPELNNRIRAAPRS